VEALVARRWDRIVNVGGGNGLYVAGLGRRVPHAALIVFELEAAARAVIADTLRRNALSERTTLLGAAEPDGLARALEGTGETLVVMDVEGAELELADPARIPALATSTLLIETHDFARPGCLAALRERFTPTHALREIRTRPRTLEDFPAALVPGLVWRAPARCLEAVQEWRPEEQAWLLAEPRAEPRGATAPRATPG
jgi:hypothetical protein